MDEFATILMRDDLPHAVYLDAEEAEVECKRLRQCEGDGNSSSGKARWWLMQAPLICDAPDPEEDPDYIENRLSDEVERRLSELQEKWEKETTCDSHP